MAKMVRRTCAFCSDGEAGSVMYIAKERNIAAHQDCLLFSSGFVESEEYNPDNLDLRFDVASVLKELKRGKRLVCNFCRKKGATVGCEERACRRSYHYFCALCDDAATETDEVNGVYRVFCPKHDPGNRTNHYDTANKRRRHTLKSSTMAEQMSTQETAEENSLRILKRKNNRHKGVTRFIGQLGDTVMGCTVVQSLELGDSSYAADVSPLHVGIMLLLGRLSWRLFTFPWLCLVHGPCIGTCE
ncbi:PHD finger protein 11 isoform 2-T7 [Amazona ochrocephala]